MSCLYLFAVEMEENGDEAVGVIEPNDLDTCEMRVYLVLVEMYAARGCRHSDRQLSVHVQKILRIELNH